MMPDPWQVLLCMVAQYAGVCHICMCDPDATPEAQDVQEAARAAKALRRVTV